MSLVIADTGALIYLGLVNQIEHLEKVFDQVFIAHAVWEELNKYDNPLFDKSNFVYLQKRIKEIKSENNLLPLLDYGESESILLYKEINANFLLIDDQKARKIAESLNVNCIGSIGFLIKAKQKGYLQELKPIFASWLTNKRYFALSLLNEILVSNEEEPIKI